MAGFLPAFGAAPVLQYGPAPGPAWPVTWTPIPSLNDPVDKAAGDGLDFVGSSTYPGAYYAADSSYFFFRARVNGDHDLWHDAVLLLLTLDTVGANPVPNYAFAWDSKSNDNDNHGLELMVLDSAGATWASTRMDDIDGNNAKKISPPDFNTTGDGYILTSDAQLTPGEFGGTTSFIDFAVSWALLAAATGLEPNQEWRLQLASIQNATDHNLLNYDVAANSNPADPTRAWSAPILVVPEPAFTALGMAVVLAGVAGVRFGRFRRRLD
ncbi:MAG: hypothetical protein H7A46_11630 [Verrucomicrobiales bacterium]|nr:hypothetical protein [Verrucomicrobiales bacterium]